MIAQIDVARPMVGRRPALKPQQMGTLGAVGQPYTLPDAGLPALSETTLIQAHRGCTCRDDDRMPWESWSPGQWEWFRRRQRVMAQRTAQRERRAKGAA
jgi:hypothetical protein